MRRCAKRVISGGSKAPAAIRPRKTVYMNSVAFVHAPTPPPPSLSSSGRAGIQCRREEAWGGREVGNVVSAAGMAEKPAGVEKAVIEAWLVNTSHAFSAWHGWGSHSLPPLLISQHPAEARSSTWLTSHRHEPNEEPPALGAAAQ